MRTKDIPQRFKEVGDILQNWERGKSLLGYDEVLVWKHRDRIGVALRGDALRIEKRVFEVQMLDNKGHYLDYDMQRAFGLDVSYVYQDRYSRPIGIRGGAGQTIGTPDTHFSELLSGMESAIHVYLEETGLDIDAQVTLMPKEGEPWEPEDSPTPYYNARTRSVELSKKPDFLMDVEVRDEDTGSGYIKTLGVDFCKLVPTMKSDSGGALMVHDPEKNVDFMMTHSFDFHRTGIGWRTIAKFIKNCGGLLFPSIGVGQIPAATFGNVCFVIDPMIVLQGMKPYRTSKGRWPVVTYSTDVWTETTTAFIGENSALAFKQLTGQWQPSVYGQAHFYILGPMIDPGGPVAVGPLILDTNTLSKTVARRARVWHRDLPGEDVIGLQDVLTVDRYPYLEAKVNGIVSVDSLVVCVAPGFLMKPVKAMLKAIDFKGEIISIPVSKAEEKALEQTMYATIYDYSWRVHDAVADIARSTGRVESLRSSLMSLPDVLRQVSGSKTSRHSS